MEHQFPYTNVHDLNIDWILSIVKDFKTKYEGIDEKIDEAIRTLDEKTQETVDYINGVQDEMEENFQEVLNTKLAELESATQTCITTIQTVGTAQANILTTIVGNIPDTYQDAVNQLQIINSILNETYNYPIKVQGEYANGSLPSSITQSSTKVSTQAIAGCAGRKLNVKITNGTAIIRGYVYWTGWDENAVWHFGNISTENNPVTEWTYTFPANVTYFSILFTYDYTGETSLSVNDFSMQMKWKSNLIERIDNDLSVSLRPETGDLITSNTYNNYFTDANNAPKDRSFFIEQSITNTMVLNLPFYGRNGFLFTLSTIKSGSNANNGLLQIYYDTAGSNNIYYRRKTTSWGNWYNINSIAENAANTASAPAYQPALTETISSSNYSTIFTDANNAPNNRAYFIGSTITSDMIANLPFYGANMMLFTFGTIKNALSGAWQIALKMTTSEMYYRTRTTTWRTWNSVLTSIYDNDVKYRNANVSIVGDSISTFENYIPTGNAKYYPTGGTNNVTDVSQTWWYKVINSIKANLLCNDSYSGSTVANKEDLNRPSFVQRISERYNSSNIDKVKPDVLFFFGGTNDSYYQVTIGTAKYSDWTENDLTQFAPALCYCFDALKKWLPFTKIYCITNHHSSQTYRDTISEVCAHYNITNIDSGSWSANEGHPDQAGMITIANSVLANI